MDQIQEVKINSRRSKLVGILLSSKALLEFVGLTDESKKRLERFVVSFLDIGKGINLKDFASKQETFPLGKFRIFTTSPDIEREKDSTLRENGRIIGYDKFGYFLDAPFAVLLEFKSAIIQGKEIFKPMSIIAFQPDFKNEILQVKQIQGVVAIELEKDYVPILNRVRFKFKYPEGVLLDQVISLCRVNNLDKISIPDYSERPATEYRKPGIYLKAAEYLKSKFGEPIRQHGLLIFDLQNS